MLKDQRLICLRLSAYYYVLILLSTLLGGLISLKMKYYFWIPIAIILPIIIAHFSPQLLVSILDRSPYNGPFKKNIDTLTRKYRQKIKVFRFNKSFIGGIALSFGSNRTILISDKYDDSYNNWKAVFFHELDHHKNNDLFFSLLGHVCLIVFSGLYASIFLNSMK